MSTAAPVRVAIVEDDTVLLETLAQTIASSGEFAVVGMASSLAAGLLLLAKRPQLLLVDMALPDGTGTELMAAARSAGLECRCLVLSLLGDAESVVRAIEAGADGYLLKASSDPESVLVALRTVRDGGAPLSPAVARHILARLRTDPPRVRPARPKQALSLTPRELEILDALAKGLSYKECAKLHDISHHTVAEHVKLIYKKLQVNSRAEAVFEAVNSGILRLNE